MSTRSGRVRSSVIDTSPPRTRKGVSPNRSPARVRKSSPARKSSPPARSVRKSPARKSPSRKPISKFPARKSPSRATKEVAEVAPLKSPVKRPAIKHEVSVKLENMTGKLDTFRGTRSKRIEYSIKDITTTSHEISDLSKVNGLEPLSEDIYGLRSRRSADEFLQRRTSNLKEFSENLPDIRRSVSKSISQSGSKSVSQSIDTFSDEENSEEDQHREISQSATRKLATPLRNSVNKFIQISDRWEFGGRFGSLLLMFLLPLTVFAIIISCIKSCSIKALLDLSGLRSLSVWFSLPAALVISGQYFIQALFALVPIFGTKADRMDGSGTKYTFNALFASIVTVNILFALHFFGVFNKDVLLNEYLQLAIASYVFAVILSTYLYFKPPTSKELNPYGTTGYTLYDFFMGKEIHPFISKLDVKIWISRVSSITTLTLSILIFRQGIHFEMKNNEIITLDNYKEIWENIKFQPTILLFSMMQLIYALNFIMKEYKMTSTFYWQSEGMGYLQIVSSSLYPFYFTTISKFVADTKLSLSTNTLISASVIFVLGFFIMLISNNIKYEFRRNPLQPGLANMDSMPTFHGKKLLVAGIWGILRHPNYAGDVLIHISLALPGILTQQMVVVVPALLTVLVLAHRAWRDHARCRRRYGAAWQRYCKRVPSVLIPKVL